VVAPLLFDRHWTDVEPVAEPHALGYPPCLAASVGTADVAEAGAPLLSATHRFARWKIDRLIGQHVDPPRFTPLHFDFLDFRW
jgi:hypothetical protein